MAVEEIQQSDDTTSLSDRAHTESPPPPDYTSPSDHQSPSMSHTPSASLDSPDISSPPLQHEQPQPQPQPQQTLSLLQPMDLSAYYTPTPVISHTSLNPATLSSISGLATLANGPPLSHDRYQLPGGLSTPPTRGRNHQSMTSIGSVTSVTSMTSLGSMGSISDYSGDDSTVYTNSHPHTHQQQHPHQQVGSGPYSLAGTPYTHSTPLVQMSSVYDSPDQVGMGQGYMHPGQQHGGYASWGIFRLNQPDETDGPGKMGDGGVGAYESMRGLAPGFKESGGYVGGMDGSNGLTGAGQPTTFGPVDGMGGISTAVLPEWRGYPYAQPGYADAEMWDGTGEVEDVEDAKKKARKHVCPVCDKRFNRPSSLSTHMAVHTGAKPYRCPNTDCGRCFSVSSNLRRHMRTHSSHETRKARSNSRSPSTDLLTTSPAPDLSNSTPLSLSTSLSTSPPTSDTANPNPIYNPFSAYLKSHSQSQSQSQSHSYTTSALPSYTPLGPIAPLSSLTFPRSMHTHTRSTPNASMGVGMGMGVNIPPIIPYSHGWGSSAQSWGMGGGAYGGDGGETLGGAAGLSGMGGMGGVSTPLPTGMSVLSFGSATTATGLDQYSLRKTSASAGGD